MGRKGIESAIAAAVTLGGIFGLIVDAPGVFALAVKVFTAPYEWLREMNGAIGYWLLIIGGIASLAWIHFGDKISPRWLDRIIRPFRPTVTPDVAPVTHIDLVKIAQAIRESADFASEIAHLTKETAIKEMQLMLLRDMAPKIDNVARQLDDMGSRLDQSDCDLNALLYHALYEMNLRTLRDLLSRAPALAIYYEQEEITTEWLNEQRTMASEFVARTIKDLRYTPRFDRLLSVIANAENEADQEVKHTPVDRRPKEVDPFDLRSYVIEVRKCEKVVLFLAQEERELVEKTQAQREAIQERFSLKNP